MKGDGSVVLSQTEEERHSRERERGVIRHPDRFQRPSDDMASVSQRWHFSSSWPYRVDKTRYKWPSTTYIANAAAIGQYWPRKGFFSDPICKEMTNVGLKVANALVFPSKRLKIHLADLQARVL